MNQLTALFIILAIRPIFSYNLVKWDNAKKSFQPYYLKSINENQKYGSEKLYYENYNFQKQKLRLYYPEVFRNILSV